jgi:hypothetical protein
VASHRPIQCIDVKSANQLSQPATTVSKGFLKPESDIIQSDNTLNRKNVGSKIDIKAFGYPTLAALGSRLPLKLNAVPNVPLV